MTQMVKRCFVAIWPELLEAWLALASVNYYRNVYYKVLKFPNQ